MRVWSLFAVLVLAAPGCAGLDLAAFDDEAMAALLDEASAAVVAPASGPHPAAAPDPARPEPSGVAAIAPRDASPDADIPEPRGDRPEGTAGDDLAPDRGASRPGPVLASTAPGRDEPRELPFLEQLDVRDVMPGDAPPSPGPADAARRPTVIATVGPREITLPELTRSIRERIDRLPGGRVPTRREVIAMVRAEMEARVLEALVLQQAEATLGDGPELHALRSAIERSWAESELPRVLRREGLADADALDARLAATGRRLDDLRAVYASRALARELSRREGRARDDLDAYLAELRDRFPIRSDLLPTPRPSAG